MDQTKQAILLLCSMGVLIVNTQISADTGVVMSPNFPENYPDNATMMKTIEVPVNKVIQIHFTDFHIENVTSCSYDYLQITDGDEKKVLFKSCGDNVPENLTSSTNTVDFFFKSDESETFSGFKLTWRVVPPNVSGEYTSPKFPEDYPA